ncbi:hypothetical protein AB0F46_24185 [Streptomyces sp. NPDC026665]|uniref:hypothetical protein n=1 Tax=Streptomyces sp. NPDC026665 TaxID=3154798 RepID=UPI003400BB01
MLRTAEITAELTGVEDTRHQLYWRSRLEFSLDCFVCERTGRTTVFERGAEQALCSGSRSGFQRHRTAGRIAGFDITSGRDRLAVRALVDFWWAPFTDSRDRRTAAAPTGHPWVRLLLAYHCPEANESGTGSIQTNQVRPHPLTCKHCDRRLGVDSETPAVRLLG